MSLACISSTWNAFADCFSCCCCGTFQFCCPLVAGPSQSCCRSRREDDDDYENDAEGQLGVGYQQQPQGMSQMETNTHNRAADR
ncbi:hypothetical protein PENSPDRAFT_652328 [Peniophora sp. CONT]|nr:hypothetical protein PENSPDRAFT_652328 [Peniophora sp. CONT]